MNKELLTWIDSKKLPPVVVLDIDFSGYGVVRSLVPYQVPVIAFYSSAKFIPESKSRLCPVIRYKDDEDLMSLLMQFGQLRLKPVLIPTMDYFVALIMKNRERITSVFKINYPGNPILEMLLSKCLFNDFAIQNGVLIPKSHIVNHASNLSEILADLAYPVILKPFIRKPHWQSAGLPKAFYCENESQLKASYEKTVVVEDSLIIQEWVPGGDNDIFYCLVYFDDQSRCKGVFSGQKIRQWPVDTGSTASTKPARDPFLREETIRIFAAAGYKGFGSIEYKKHAINGRYYLIEPTAGRLNQQEYVATLNGENLPLIGYCDMAGVTIDNIHKPLGEVIYIDEPAELLSVFVHLKRGSLTFKEWMQSLRGTRRYRYFNWKDLTVFICLFVKLMRLVIMSITTRPGKH